MVLRLHYGQSVLISSPAFATTLEPGNLLSTTPYVDETAGFGQEFNSASEALSSQSSSSQASTLTTITAARGYSAFANDTSIPTRADSETPDQVVPDQPFAQNPGQPLSSSAVKQSIIDSASPNTMKVSSPLPGKAAPQARGNRLPPAEDAKGNRSSQDQSKTPVAPGPAPAVAALSTASATLVQTAPASTPIGFSKAASSPAGPVYNVAKRISEFTDSRADAPSGEPPAEGPVAPAAVPNSSAAAAAQNLPEVMAFAVRVQPAKTAPLPSRVAAGQPVSGNSSAAGAEDASSRAHATRQTLESDADKGGSSAEDATPKGREKSKAAGEEPAQSPSMPDGSAPIRTSSVNLDALSQPAAQPGQSGSQSPDPMVRTAEPPSVSETTPPQGPMKEISMRLEAAEGQKVDVRIVQRAGDLQIAVKSADDVTTQGLRHGLADLANRLNETGYHAETWRPGQQTAPESSSTSSENPSHQSQSDGSQSHSGGPQQDRGQRDNNPSNRPHWIEELQSNLSGGTESSGQFNGIVSQSTI